MHFPCILCIKIQQNAFNYVITLCYFIPEYRWHFSAYVKTTWWTQIQGSIWLSWHITLCDMRNAYAAPFNVILKLYIHVYHKFPLICLPYDGLIWSEAYWKQCNMRQNCVYNPIKSIFFDFNKYRPHYKLELPFTQNTISTSETENKKHAATLEDFFRKVLFLWTVFISEIR